MAKFVAEFDSKEKTLVLKKDGEVISDIDSISFYNKNYDWDKDDDDEFCMSVNLRTKDENDGTRTTTTVCASEKVPEHVTASEHPELEGYKFFAKRLQEVKEEGCQARKDIHKFFESAE